MDATISDGLYFPFALTLGPTGGAPPPCPDPVSLTPVEPTVTIGELIPQVTTSGDDC